MSNVVKPKISKIECSDYSGVSATLNIGNTFWRIKIEKDETVSVFDKYSIGEKELNNLKATLADADTTIDEHCHDAFLVEEFNKWQEEKRIEAEKKQKEKEAANAKELADLTAEVKMSFPSPSFTFKIHGYYIDISDGTSEVTAHRDPFGTQRWSVDAREWHESSGRYGHRYSSGEKKSSVKISKLAEFIKQVLKNKTATINYKKDVVKTTEETDAEMLALGWEPGAQGESIGRNAETKQYDYKKISNSGTTYRKNNKIIYVKRVDDVIKVTKYVVEGLDINISEFKI